MNHTSKALDSLILHREGSSLLWLLDDTYGDRFFKTGIVLAEVDISKLFGQALGEPKA